MATRAPFYSLKKSVTGAAVTSEKNHATANGRANLRWRIIFGTIGSSRIFFAGGGTTLLWLDGWRRGAVRRGGWCCWHGWGKLMHIYLTLFHMVFACIEIPRILLIKGKLHWRGKKPYYISSSPGTGTPLVGRPMVLISIYPQNIIFKTLCSKVF